jgi:drug/metabolite transporter (DMT)-like permease
MSSDSRDQLRGRLLIVSAAVLWSTSALFAKSPVLEAWPPEVRGPLMAFWRALFGGLVLVPFIRRPQWNGRLVPAALCFAAMNLTFLQALTWTTGANAIWLQYTAPLWVFLVGVFWLGEKATGRDVWMVVCGMLGVATILVLETERALQSGGDLSGIMWGLASGVGFAAVVLTARAMRRVDPAWLMVLNFLTTAALMLPYVVAIGIWPTWPQLAWMAAFGGLQMGLPYVLFTRGLRHVTAHEASVIALLEPLLVPLWVYAAWRASPTYRAPSWWTFVGGALILIGLLVRYAIAGSASVRRSS